MLLGNVITETPYCEMEVGKKNHSWSTPKIKSFSLILKTGKFETPDISCDFCLLSYGFSYEATLYIYLLLLNKFRPLVG